jgi:hypothetical protein
MMVAFALLALPTTRAIIAANPKAILPNMIPP